MPSPSYPKDNESGARTSETAGFSLYSIIDWLFAVKDRETLDEQTGGDKSDGRWTWGL